MKLSEALSDAELKRGEAGDRIRGLDMTKLPGGLDVGDGKISLSELQVKICEAMRRTAMVETADPAANRELRKFNDDLDEAATLKP